jgi:hypothetical protein
MNFSGLLRAVFDRRKFKLFHNCLSMRTQVRDCGPEPAGPPQRDTVLKSKRTERPNTSISLVLMYSTEQWVLAIKSALIP